MNARLPIPPTLGRISILFLPLLAALAFATPQFPPLTGRVVDGAGLLSSEQVRSLTNKLAAHETDTTNQVVVVTVQDLQGYPIEDYGYQLGRHWGIGQQGKDNGVLLIVAPNERSVRIEVGYGLEGMLTDALSKVVIEREIVPRFKRGDMPGGIVVGTDAILQILAGEYTPPKRAVRQNRKKDALSELLIFVVAFVFIITLRLMRAQVGSNGWGGRSGGGSLGGWGGGFGGGGGFSGGGGSFGGGGASGRW
jgi:uncharacterized protein